MISVDYRKTGRDFATIPVQERGLRDLTLDEAELVTGGISGMGIVVACCIVVTVCAVGIALRVMNHD